MIAKVLILCFVVSTVLARPQADDIFSYEPYKYQYAIEDDEGNQHTKTEEADGTGNVLGEFYLYDAFYQTYRRVRYESSPLTGIRFFIESNEPGMGNENPADVELTVQDPPADVYTKEYPRRRV